MTGKTAGSAPLLGIAVLALTAIGPVLAASSGGDASGSSPEPARAESNEVPEWQAIFDRGMELVKEGKYVDAMSRFEKAHQMERKNADVLNMLAYTQRKTGNLEKAFETYGKALAIQPKFPQAREYLGEAHIQAALLQVEILRGYGKEGNKEYDELVAALRKAAETLSAESMRASAPTGGSDW